MTAKDSMIRWVQDFLYGSMPTHNQGKEYDTNINNMNSICFHKTC